MTGPATITPGGSSATQAAQEAAGAAGCGPVIVLTYAHSGHELLPGALSASRAVACTHGTGLLPLCHSAVSTWQNVENRGTAASPLALKSVRMLVNTMTAALQSAAGAARWCETAYTGRAAAETFLRVFPEATLLCLHRSLPAVLADGIRAYPWGLGSSPFWYHAADHPGNNVATIAEYWVAHTEQLLALEEAHPQSCLRVRHEDLASEPHRHVSEIFARLGLDPQDLVEPGQPAPGRQPAGGTGRRQSARDAGPGTPPPLMQMPPQLLAKASDLHISLGYGPLTP